MKHTFTRWALAVAVALMPATSLASNWDAALEHLTRAEQALEAATHDKGGHRKSALEEIYKAEDEVHQAQQKRRDHKDGDRGHGGHVKKVDVSDLVGEKARSLDSEMESRGFRSTGGYKQDSTAYTTWHNERTGQCVEAAVTGGQIDSMKPIAEGNCL